MLGQTIPFDSDKGRLATAAGELIVRMMTKHMAGSGERNPLSPTTLTAMALPVVRSATSVPYALVRAEEDGV